MLYETSYSECPTGVYRLVGTVPQYMAKMLFESEWVAIQAKNEAEKVLENGEVSAGVFAQLYLNGILHIAAQDLHNEWSIQLDEMQEPQF